jgi:hypothetical protein
MNNALLITGSRRGLNFTNQEQIYLLKKLFTNKNLLIHGDAPGVDAIFKKYAIKNNISKIDMPADFKNLGKKAGPQRNQAMVDIAIVLRSCGWKIFCAGFPGPDSIGTYDCINRIKKAGFDINVNAWGL